MPSLHIMTPGTRVHLSGEHLEIFLPSEGAAAAEPLRAAHPAQRNVPLAEVERVFVGESVAFSTAALVELVSRGVTVVLQSNGGKAAGLAVPARRNTVPLMAQLDAVRDVAVRVAAARVLIQAKIFNMRRVLQRLAANRRESPEASAWLTCMAEEAFRADTLDTLRGVEGAATGRYFSELNFYFPTKMPFEHRSRRPPHNGANALLSYFYTLLAGELTALLHGHGLEPGWGVLHEVDDYRPAMALDLMEPYRAPLCDALVLDLLNHKRIGPEDFLENADKGGFYLIPEARRRVHAAWEDRLEREFYHEQTCQRTTLRRSMEALCLGVRRYFSERTPLVAFWMN